MGGGRQTTRFFVEFGAADGMAKSNTYFLEKEMYWKGIVAEPNPNFAASVRKHRNCIVSDICVYSKSGERIEFLATEVGELSRIGLIDPQDGQICVRQLEYSCHAVEHNHTKMRASILELMSRHGLSPEMD